MSSDSARSFAQNAVHQTLYHHSPPAPSLSRSFLHTLMPLNVRSVLTKPSYNSSRCVHKAELTAKGLYEAHVQWSAPFLHELLPVPHSSARVLFQRQPKPQ